LTYTVQPLARTAIENVGNTGKAEAHENIVDGTIHQLLSICDSLNRLYEKLSRLDYVIKRKIMETNLTQKGKGIL